MPAIALGQPTPHRLTLRNRRQASSHILDRGASGRWEFSNPRQPHHRRQPTARCVLQAQVAAESLDGLLAIVIPNRPLPNCGCATLPSERTARTPLRAYRRRFRAWSITRITSARLSAGSTGQCRHSAGRCRSNCSGRNAGPSAVPATAYRFPKTARRGLGPGRFRSKIPLMPAHRANAVSRWCAVRAGSSGGIEHADHVVQVWRIWRLQLGVFDLFQAQLEARERGVRRSWRPRRACGALADLFADALLHQVES